MAWKYWFCLGIITAVAVEVISDESDLTNNIYDLFIKMWFNKFGLVILKYIMKCEIGSNVDF